MNNPMIKTASRDVFEAKVGKLIIRRCSKCGEAYGRDEVSVADAFGPSRASNIGVVKSYECPSCGKEA